MRVLIVEDEKDMAVVLKEGLEEEDYFVSLAFDGLSALEVARSCEFDVIILDVMLPKLREGRISVVLNASDGAAVTEIGDSGVGISPTALPHIFERFYRADESRSRESGGSGLGLSIAKWIAEAHQGEVSVTSKVGEGSVFRVEIPLSKADA